jgi:hypothetical protein
MTEGRDRSSERREGEPPPYEPPRILWEETLSQGPNIFAACGKVGGTGSICDSAPGS